MRCGETLRTIYWHSTLIEFLSVSKDVLAHFTKINEEVAAMTISRSFLPTVYKRVEHPELDILYVGSLKVVGVQFSHHTAPTLNWVRKSSVAIQVRVEVISTSLGRIISEIEYRQRVRSTAIGALVTVRIELININFTHIVV